MASSITFSGFNNIDFTVVLNAVMAQESRPLAALQSRQKDLESTDAAYGQLATNLGALRAAAGGLASGRSLVTYSATSSDAAAVSVTGSREAVAGRYDVIVHELARAQTTVSTSTAPDTDTTSIADGGTLTIGGIAI